ncbi:uncharacterized protein LOC136029675 [Artemia franciscana]|uniref:uncharacterized protein LOC136029675 n=1 Tax=Artemia franciscana TaxID=6661 RepID=UPI0032DBE4BC
MGHANYFELTGGQKFGLQGLVQRKHEVTLPSYEDAVRERAPPPYDAVVGTFRGVIRSSVAPMALRTVRTGRRSRTGGNLQNRATERIDNSDSVSQHSAFSGPFFPNRCGGGSLRTASYAGSIGSLDTVAASEGSGSTVVTHASDATSYSASSANSQTASTRGVCGSLASFDTLSMQNNEGVPLLEETEFDVPLESEGVENESQVMEP